MSESKNRPQEFASYQRLSEEEKDHVLKEFKKLQEEGLIQLKESKEPVQ